MSKSFPIALLCSDIHLSLKPPYARAKESDWFEAMARPLNVLTLRAQQLKVPVICAGDIFDRWNSPAEVINFAIAHLPLGMICVPGQHDLPYHNYMAIEKSAYWTLAKAKAIKHLGHQDGMTIEVKGPSRAHVLNIFGFGWDEEITPLPKDFIGKDEINLAVVHKYIHDGKNKYEEAPDEVHVKEFTKQLRGYDAALFGDNHKWFTTMAGQCEVINTGTMMRRKTDEVDYEPVYGVLYSDGSIETDPYPIGLDVIATKEGAHLEIEDGAVRDFVRELDRIGYDALDFREAINQYFDTHEITKEARSIILKALES